MHIFIIGGGIIGLCTAYYLLQDGHKVTLGDMGNMENGCSYGNAGMIVPSHVVPLASPGMISRGLKWMFREDSPFFIKPGLSPDLWKWGWHFFRASRKKHLYQSVNALRDISLFSKKLYKELADCQDISFSLEEKGLLMLYRSAEAEKDSLHEARIAQKAGIDARILRQEEVQDMEPEVELNVRGSVFYPGDAHLVPEQFIQSLKEFLIKKGCVFLKKEEIISFETSRSAIKSVLTLSDKFTADAFVIAAGSWSAGLARKLGIHLPLQAGKGYSFTLHHPPVQLRHPAILTEAKVAVTPMSGVIRLAGTLEIAGLSSRVNSKRAKSILNAMPQYYSGLNLKMPGMDQVWVGLRPCSPDGLPYIGKSKKHSNLLIASGHAMMGLSLAPATGKLITEQINGQSSSINTDQFDPERYNRR